MLKYTAKVYSFPTHREKSAQPLLRRRYDAGFEALTLPNRLGAENNRDRREAQSSAEALWAEQPFPTARLGKMRKRQNETKQKTPPAIYRDLSWQLSEENAPQRRGCAFQISPYIPHPGGTGAIETSSAAYRLSTTGVINEQAATLGPIDWEE